MRTSQVSAALAGLAVLAALLALVDVAPVAALFDGVARALAVAAAPVLEAIGLPVDRAGVELRAANGGWAVAVTEVCDGHGLVAAWAALVVMLARSARQGLAAFLLGVLAIQLFNLARVVVLAAVLARAPQGFEAVHLELFPLLTLALFAGCAAALLGLSWRPVLLALLAGGAAALLWFFAVAGSVAPLLVPVANGIAGLVGPQPMGEIARQGEVWTVATRLVAGLDPLRLHQAVIWPGDFMVALPALVGAALVVPGRAWWLIPALIAMALAMALGAITAFWSVWAAVAPVEQVVPGEAGAALAPVVPWSEAARAAVRLAQNVLVHALLLVLPVRMLAEHRDGG